MTEPLEYSAPWWYQQTVQGTAGAKRFKLTEDWIFDKTLGTRPRWSPPFAEFSASIYGDNAPEVQAAYQQYVQLNAGETKPKPETLRQGPAVTFRRLTGFHPERVRKIEFKKILEELGPPY